MHEQTKALPRRIRDPAYRRYFRGWGLDLGAGPDPLNRNKEHFPGMISAEPWDKEQGDAQHLPGVTNSSVDFVFASHVLEHLEQPYKAVARWLDVVKRDGHVIVTVPDWEMYERCQWPSPFSLEHKWSFTMDRSFIRPHKPHLIYIPDFLEESVGLGILERLMVIRENFDPNAPVTTDQTMGPAECAIEIVLRRIS